MEKIVQTSHINQIQYLLIPLFTFITNNFNKKFCFELLLLITVCVCVCVCVCLCMHVHAQYYLIFTTMDYSPLGFSFHGIFQAQILE